MSFCPYGWHPFTCLTEIVAWLFSCTLYWNWNIILIDHKWNKNATSKSYICECTEAAIILPWISIDFQVKFRRPKMGTVANIKKHNIPIENVNWWQELWNSQRNRDYIVLYCYNIVQLVVLYINFRWDFRVERSGRRQSAIEYWTEEKSDGRSPAVKTTRKFPKWYIDCQWNSVLRVEKSIIRL